MSIAREVNNVAQITVSYDVKINNNILSELSEKFVRNINICPVSSFLLLDIHPRSKIYAKK